jgi:pimeloyl-ACP methyl ester carboxylesterase
MPMLTINNISLYYEQYGSGDDLVLIGGLTADHQVWKATVRVLSKYFRVTIFDNRGAGQSSAPNFPYTTEMMAQDTVALMDALQISRAHILGHSMGGRIAQQIAILYPDRINALLIACSHAKPSNLANMIFSMREKLQRLGMTEVLLAEYVMPFLFAEEFLSHAAQVHGFIQWTVRNAFAQTAVGYTQQFAAVKTHDVMNQLQHIQARTLLIAGEEDILSPATSLALLSKSLKNSTFVAMPHCAHMPHVEKPAEFSEIVLRFLR